MKFSNTCLLTIIAATFRSNAKAQSTEPCVAGGFVIEFEGECKYSEALEAFTDDMFDEVETCDHSAEEDFKLLLGLNKTASEEEASAVVRAVCVGAWDNHKKVPFADIAREYGQFEQNYFNGGTYWNEEVETLLENEDGSRSNHLRYDARYVKQFYNSEGQTNMVEWPDYLTNFDPDTCEMGAAYCCWPQDRQANDNNGNCDDPYDERCYDKDPADNTDLCYVDLEASPKSNPFGSSGSILFPYDNSQGEGAIHCHGFAWSTTDEYDFTSRYKANNLFYVSMYDHMHQRGYVRNIPGAPMCGCAEQMPIASRSDCTQIDVDESYKFTYNPVNKTFTGSLEEIEIDFNSCRGKFNENNDLWYYFLRLQDEGKVTADQKHALNKYLVNDYNCKMAYDYHMSTKGLIPGYQEDTTQWLQFAGRDSMYFSGIDAISFRELFAEADHKIIHRVCATCLDSHKHIYYKRLTDVPNTMNLLHVLKNSWISTNNAFNVDFELYSSFEDAIAGQNRWTFCNFNSGRGFPYECGPTGKVTWQWSRFHWAYGRTDVGFYMRKSLESQGRSETSMRQVNGVDIGDVKVAGHSFFKDDKYYIGGSGNDIWRYEDQFYFVSQEVTGDVSIQVRVEEITRTHDWTKSGLMIRETLTGPSRTVACMNTGKHGPVMHWRLETGEHMKIGPYQYNSQISDIWLKLTRNGDEFKCYKSSDGNSWSLISSVTVDMGNTVHYGMCHTSHNDYVKGEAVMSGYDVDFLIEGLEETYSSINSELKDATIDAEFDSVVQQLPTDRKSTL